MKLTHPQSFDHGPSPGGGAKAVPWLLLAWLLAGAGPAASQDLPLGRHAGLPCSACHVMGAENRPVVPAAGADRACARCHVRTMATTDHPSGIVPARALPAAFPLDADGRMTCLTCHAPHGGGTSLLRSGGPRACTPCHQK